ncbi:hypothetical protein Dda_8850 [Drechslerella dactyloides]|uniref:Uncharacterized protein n=1 Tax=Drechslerella dactyloides TaxID=74499 RepID=A0AAD6IQA4_DREDA|nr:hypothetical protein Dda_8850 [Drechslerella dactyloides]
MPCTSSDKQEEIDAIERRRANAFTIELQFRQAQIHQVDTEDRRILNHKVRFPHDEIIPIVARRERNGISTFESPPADIFPATVEKFVEMDALQIMTLLAFYDLTAFRLAFPKEGRRNTPETVVIPLAEESIDQHKYECMTTLAQHLGLKWWKIHSTKMEEMREASTFAL